MNLTIINISQIVNAQFFGLNPAATIENVSIDSRSLQNDSHTLFFCLTGVNNDGHKYIPELVLKGVKNFVVTQTPENQTNKINFLVVENAIIAFQQFATNYRSKFYFPIIGITGSNGKTIVKEWLNFLLNPNYNIIKSPKSYNSQIGVPLSIFGINENHNFGIFEAGISTINEMENLQKIINPTIGVLTNIGTAHDEGFENVEIKIKEKLKLFVDCKIIICKKNKIVDELLNENQKTFSWSFNDNKSNVFVEKKSNLVINYIDKKFEIETNLKDNASTENIVTCIMVLLYLGYDTKTIQMRIKLLFPIEMRMQIKAGTNNTILIDDSYSSDYQSLKIALDFLEVQNQHKKKTLILSDIFQSGLSKVELNLKIRDLIISNKIDRIIAIGENNFDLKNIFHFKTTIEFLSKIKTLKFENETILIKGARHFEFEKIVSFLEQKKHQTVLEINLNSISHNLNFYKSKLKPSVKLMVMVKAFGYGNGSFEIAKLLQHHNVNYLGVAFTDEGIELKRAGITIPIMILNPETTNYDAIIENNLEPEIYSLKGLKSFIKIVDEKKINQYPIHIKLNTGMNRLGFDEENIDNLIKILSKNKSVFIKTILSHLATSEDLNNKFFAQCQIDLYKEMVNKLIFSLKINPIKHILSTSGISNFMEAQFDMVRLGIGLYGISNNIKEQQYLENVSTLKSIISQIRIIQKGKGVGYSRQFIAIKPTKIATIPIGYADGINRHWGNEKGYVTINNQKATILGNICMDMLMADISNINCNEGDEVIIFGKSPTVREIAKELQTISYEILTGISQRVKRIFYRE